MVVVKWGARNFVASFWRTVVQLVICLRLSYALRLERVHMDGYCMRGSSCLRVDPTWIPFAFRTGEDLARSMVRDIVEVEEEQQKVAQVQAVRRTVFSPHAVSEPSAFSPSAVSANGILASCYFGILVVFLVGSRKMMV